MANVQLTCELPSEHRMVSLAPRVRGEGDFVGEYGYALAMDASGNVQVAWDDGGTDFVSPTQLVFMGT